MAASRTPTAAWVSRIGAMRNNDPTSARLGASTKRTPTVASERPRKSRFPANCLNCQRVYQPAQRDCGRSHDLTAIDSRQQATTLSCGRMLEACIAVCWCRVPSFHLPAPRDHSSPVILGPSPIQPDQPPAFQLSKIFNNNHSILLFNGFPKTGDNCWIGTFFRNGRLFGASPGNRFRR